MTTTYYTATTLDGFIATEEHSLAWLLSRTSGEDGPLDYAAFIAGVGALCMGANTYRWLQRELGADGSWPYLQPTWVFSRSGVEAWPGADVRVTAADVAEVHAEMAAAAGGKAVWIVGGGDLAGQFSDAGLLDEVVVNIAPVTLGSGRPLLPRHVELQVRETHSSGEFVAVRYDVVR
ncbi:MAG: dihydrofolate reductase family protein [Propionicimonas sp.]|uniref:dihydrofolate reductase family protein n=1 Tax=Propionicimonas sp. TaxID=1955623 RepID=UPI003D0D9D38